MSCCAAAKARSASECALWSASGRALTPLRGFQTPFFAVAPMRPRLSDRGATWCIRRAMVSLCIVDLNFGTGPSVTKLL